MSGPEGHSCLSTAEIICIEGSKFCIWPDHCALIDPIDDPSSFIPATVVHWNKDHFGDEDYTQVCADFAKFDDVWAPSFLHALVLKAPATTVVDFQSPGKHLLVVEPAAVRIPDGPFIIQPSTGRIISVARLYEDTYCSFIGGGIAFDAPSRRYNWLGTSQIPVPSRLYYSKTARLPLAGLRFAVKDVIDVAGLESSCGSRHYHDLYPPAASSAPFINRLVDAGAVLVGKTMCTQFGDSQNPSERFDFVTPFNPRGDGYQLPSSSSSGSASSCAGYSWLDFAVGTDTGGSIRHPAGVNGIYGMRPSLETVKSRGMTISTLLDTVGVFARSPSLLEDASRCIADPSFRFLNPTAPFIRFKLLYPVCPRPDSSETPPKWFPVPSNLDEKGSAESIFERVVQKLERYLHCKRQLFSIDDLWSQTHTENGAKNLTEATETIYQRIVYFSLVHNTLSKFITDYEAAHSGRKPFLEPLLHERLNYGRDVTPSQYQYAVEELKKYSDWINKVLFATLDENEIPILIYPQSWGVPHYRDECRAAGSTIFWEGFSTFSISYASGCPDVTVPIGEVEYWSKITQHDERLPVALSFLSKPGADLILLGLLRDLGERGVLRRVDTGSIMYSEG